MTEGFDAATLKEMAKTRITERVSVAREVRERQAKSLVRKAGALALVLLAVAAGLVFARHASAQRVPGSWPATPDEVRDAERFQAASVQVNQMRMQLLQRAGARLKTDPSKIMYDPEGLRWVEVDDKGKVLADAGPVTSK